MSQALQTVDKVEVLILVDNLSDVLLPPGPFLERAPKGVGGTIATNTLLAEHGLCLLISLEKDGRRQSILLDAGYSPVAAVHNADILGLDLSQVDTMVLSHGHMDHTGAIEALLGRMKKPATMLMHPAASHAPRFLVFPGGQKVSFPLTVKPDLFRDWGATVVEEAGPSLLLDGQLLVTGQVPKVTDFEKGMPNALTIKDGQEVQDPIEDDQSLVADVAGRGLVVISGCAHSGIVNTCLHAKELTGRNKLHTIIGGFHLSGPVFEPIIEPTAQALDELGPELLVPLHCTGFKALCALAARFGKRFALSSVGSKVIVGA